VRVVCGEFWGASGPVKGVATDPRYLDVWVPPGQRRTLKVETNRHAFAYVFEARGISETPRRPNRSKPITWERTAAKARAFRQRSLVLFDNGDEVTVQAGKDGIRFLLVSGQPLEEPVAWQGPIVMNTRDELRQAYAELQDGTFIKSE